MDFLRSMFATPEAQEGAYPWAATLAGHGFVGVLLLAFCGALAWTFCAGLRRLAVIPARRPSTYALIWALVLYAIWEGAQVAIMGGGIGDAATDWVAVACGVVIGWGAWRALLGPIAIAAFLFLALLVDGVRRRTPFN